MTELCTEIKHDVFDIARRLREIDRDYFLVYSHKKSRFEVHNRRQRGGSFCLAVPFDRLDERTLRHVRRTAVTRSRQLFLEIEEQNRRLEKQELERAVKKAELTAEQVFSGRLDPRELDEMLG